jgi:hypothetical protein
MVSFQPTVFVLGLDLGPAFLLVAAGADGSMVAGCVDAGSSAGAGFAAMGAAVMPATPSPTTTNGAQ